MTLTVVYTRTHSVIRFADPYKRCERCGDWIDGVLDKSGPLVVVPCEHESPYRDVCSSWGPVDGCTCEPGTHPIRPLVDDGKTY